MDEYEKQESWREDVWAYLKVLRRHWKAVIGTVLLESAAVGLWSLGGGTMSWQIISGVIIGGVLVAAFLEWRGQQRVIEQTSQKPLSPLEIQDVKFLTKETGRFSIRFNLQNNSPEKTADDVHLSVIQLDSELKCNTSKPIPLPIRLVYRQEEGSINPGAFLAFELGHLSIFDNAPVTLVIYGIEHSHYIPLNQERKYSITLLATARDFRECKATFQICLLVSKPAVYFSIESNPLHA